MSFPIRLQLEAGQDGVAIGAQKLGEVPEGQSARTVGHGSPRDAPVLCPRPAPPDDGDEIAAAAANGAFCCAFQRIVASVRHTNRSAATFIVNVLPAPVWPYT